MDDELDLAPDEAAPAQQVLNGLSSAGPHPSLRSVLSRWARFVAEVEKGYALTSDDYGADLTVRDTIQGLLDSLSGPVWAKVARRLGRWDRRFWKATRFSETAAGNVDGPAWRMERWVWWRRIPKRPGESLGADLEREGVL